MARNNSYIIPAKCNKIKRNFYIRYDRNFAGQWIQTYGLKEKPSDNSGEKYSSTSELDISAALLGPQYKCPYCGNLAYFRCGSCKNFTCCAFEDTNVICAHCGIACQLSGTLESINVNSVKGQ